MADDLLATPWRCAMDSRMAGLEQARADHAEQRRASALAELAEYMAVERFTCLGGCNRRLPVEQAALEQPSAWPTICRDCYGEYTVAEVVAVARLAS